MSRAVVLPVLLVLWAACSRAPDAATVIVTLDRGHTIYGFAGDARGVVWEEGNHGDNHLYYLPTGGARVEIAKVVAAMDAIAVDERYVYWSDKGDVWRWSRAEHRAERRAGVGDDVGALLPRGDALWIAGSHAVYRIARDGDAGAPVGHAIVDDDLYTRDLIVLDGRVAAVAKRYGERDQPGRTVIAWADERAAPIADLRWTASTAVSDGHTLYLCQCDWTEPRTPSVVWSMTATAAPAVVHDLSEIRNGGVNLHGADARGLYLSSGSRMWRRDPDGTAHELAHRMMHGVMSADGVVYGTRLDDHREQLVRVDAPALSSR